MSNIYREAVDVKVQNRNVVVGTSAVLINNLEFQFIKGILLRAPGLDDPITNTAPIWIGNANVTADSVIETGGFPIVAGASIFIPVEFISGLYAISTAADQKLAWLGV